MVADLHPKKDPKPIIIPPQLLFILVFILLFIIAIIIAFAGRGAYYYNAPLP